MASRLAELDLVAADLIRANERVVTVERRNVGPVPSNLRQLAFIARRSYYDPRWRLFEAVPPKQNGASVLLSYRKLTFPRSVRALESQISELETEASRLLRALDSTKEAKADAERAEKRKVDEALKDLAFQVRTICRSQTTLNDCSRLVRSTV